MSGSVAPICRSLECRKIGPEWQQPLALFFEALQENTDTRFFHPHPFTPIEAAKVASYTGRDLYYCLVEDRYILAYGMLRGWDEGYTIPSLGIAVHPEERGRGIGKMLMHFLHLAARRHGATSVRLKVYTENVVALTLYEELGYSFRALEDGQYIGIKTL